MLVDTVKSGAAGSPYGPYTLSFSLAAQQRVLTQAHRSRRAVLMTPVRMPANAMVHRLRLAGLWLGRFVFDHGGLRSVHR